MRERDLNTKTPRHQEKKLNADFNHDDTTSHDDSPLRDTEVSYIAESLSGSVMGK